MSISRPPKSLGRAGQTGKYIAATSARSIEDQLWLAVKRVEQASTAFESDLSAMRKEVNLLTKQIKAANAVIIRLVQDSQPTTDYDYLSQSNHAYQKPE